jgi:hypothetical protein
MIFEPTKPFLVCVKEESLHHFIIGITVHIQAFDGDQCI